MGRRQSRPNPATHNRTCGLRLGGAPILDIDGTLVDANRQRRALPLLAGSDQLIWRIDDVQVAAHTGDRQQPLDLLGAARQRERLAALACSLMSREDDP
jgi:hypothetical protein